MQDSEKPSGAEIPLLLNSREEFLDSWLGRH
uniref:Predicted protein n=1 Tax=Hordeum vulgare subsp. vulgare TaxID=112509 RepID=F2ED39_HORVV|nr:predicted protein [Hordeum vulgare subsp. vulgare]